MSINNLRNNDLYIIIGIFGMIYTILTRNWSTIGYFLGLRTFNEIWDFSSFVSLVSIGLVILTVYVGIQYFQNFTFSDLAVLNNSKYNRIVQLFVSGSLGGIAGHYISLTINLIIIAITPNLTTYLDPLNLTLPAIYPTLRAGLFTTSLLVFIMSFNSYKQHRKSNEVSQVNKLNIPNTYLFYFLIWAFSYSLLLFLPDYIFRDSPLNFRDLLYTLRSFLTQSSAFILFLTATILFFFLGQKLSDSNHSLTIKKVDIVSIFKVVLFSNVGFFLFFVGITILDNGLSDPERIYFILEYWIKSFLRGSIQYNLNLILPILTFFGTYLYFSTQKLTFKSTIMK